MSFLGGGDASCSTGANPLGQFSKHVQDDKSLQRDRLVGRGPGGMQEGFRSGAIPGPQGNEVSMRYSGAMEGLYMLMQWQMMDEFMNQPAQMPGPQEHASPFAMDQMRREFEQLNTGPAQAPQRNGSPAHANWAAQFDTAPSLQQPQKPGGFDPGEFERYVQMKQASMNGESTNGNMTNGTSYRQTAPTTNMHYNPIYGNTMGMGMSMQRPYGGGMGFSQMQPQQQQQPQQDKGKGRMVELNDQDWESQFAQLDSQLDHMHDLDEAAVERELADIDRSVPSHLDSFLDNPTPANLSTLDDFEATWKKLVAETPELRNRSLAENHTADSFDDFSNFDMNNLDLNTHLPQNPETGAYLFEPDNIFSDISNPYEEGVRIMDENGNLSLAALAFEAAVQKDPTHVAAWTRLGAAQAQNEKEVPAIRALEQAVKLDPNDLDAIMGLSVSYVNEGYERTAYRTLERWLSVRYPNIVPPAGLENEPDIYTSELGLSGGEVLHDRVTGEFIRAAQLSPDPASMDPDVQVGLGVLFYGKEEYDKAVDCFSSALQSSEIGSLNQKQSLNQRPLLWNRLGATLANSGRSEEAITAYEKALELNPNFVRARYNLGVSCINIGCFREAAQHLLGALDMHKMVEREGREKAREIVEGGGSGSLSDEEAFERAIKHNQSTNLYDTLRKVFNNMERRDLAVRVGPGMDPWSFRGEFEF